MVTKSLGQRALGWKALGSLGAEPRPGGAPLRVWRDWALVVVLAVWSVLEAALRDDLASRPLVLTVMVVVLAPLWWRRSHPLEAVAFSFGTLIVVDLVRILSGEHAGLLASISGVLVLTYALFRWGSGREAAIGLGIVLVWLVITHVADPMNEADTVAAFAFFLFAAALGAAIRYHAHIRTRDIDEAKTREREQLARDLHDTVAHHVSGIAIQAQAGRAVAASHPERAAEVLAVIEDAASRTLTELRAMVGVLRAAEGPDFAPRPGVADLARLAGPGTTEPGQGERGEEGRGGAGPEVEVEVSGELDDLGPAVGTALYRLAQESVTNARRHARSATRVVVRVAGEDAEVRLTVDDDGSGPAGAGSSGYGVVGMRERVTLLGGTFHAGPRSDGGWRVEATLPRTGALR